MTNHDWKQNAFKEPDGHKNQQERQNFLLVLQLLKYLFQSALMFKNKFLFKARVKLNQSDRTSIKKIQVFH